MSSALMTGSAMAGLSPEIDDWAINASADLHERLEAICSYLKRSDNKVEVAAIQEDK